MRLLEKIIHFYWGRGLAYLAPAVAFYLLLLLPVLLLGLAFVSSAVFNSIDTSDVAALIGDRFAPELRSQIFDFSEGVFSGSALLFSVPLAAWTLSAVLSLLDRVMSPLPPHAWVLVLGRLRLIALALLLLLILSLALAFPLPELLALPLLWLGLSTLYRYLPRKDFWPDWREALWGALPAAALLFLAPRLFTLYISFGSFSTARGLAGLVLFLLSAYLLAFALLLGAGLSSRKTFQKIGSKNVQQED